MNSPSQIFTGMGIEFKLNVEVGRDVQLSDDLLKDYVMRYSWRRHPSVDARGWKMKMRRSFRRLLLPDRHYEADHVWAKPHSDKPYVSIEGKRVVVLGGAIPQWTA